MNSTSRALAVLTVLLLLTPAAGAAQTTPANTGASANIVAGRDTRWEFSTDGGTTWQFAFQVQNPPSVWEPGTPAYSWIAYTANGSQGGGSYLFRTLFVLTPEEAASASLSFQCAVDNFSLPPGPFSLNLGTYGGECGSQVNNFDFGPTQSISSGFVTGSNELRFSVNGDNTTDGLVVGNMMLATSAVPEPASIVLLATGLIGVAGIVSRRRRAWGQG